MFLQSCFFCQQYSKIQKPFFFWGWGPYVGFPENLSYEKRCLVLSNSLQLATCLYFLPAFRSRGWSNWIRLEIPRYYEVFTRPELRCDILRTQKTFGGVLWPVLWGEHIFEKNAPHKKYLKPCFKLF